MLVEDTSCDLLHVIIIEEGPLDPTQAGLALEDDGVDVVLLEIFPARSGHGSRARKRAFAQESAL